jgi:ADP-heptose:LPS heptosyltransferase
LKALDPLILHLGEAFLRRRDRRRTLSFGESLEGTRDILLVASRDLSDLLAMVPAARALRRRFRMARVHALASGPSAEALSGRPEFFGVLPWIDEETPILSREFLESLRRVREHGFDLAIAVDDGRARLARAVAALSGAKLRLGVHPAGKDPALNLVVAAAPPQGYAPVQSLEFLSFLGIPKGELSPTWEIPEPDHDYAKRLLDLRRHGREGWLLGVDPAQGRSGVRPNPEKLAWLVDRLASARGAVPIILTDGTDPDCAKNFRTHLKARPLDVPMRGLRDVLSLARCCDLFLSGNTSLFHFAVALGVPTVGLFPTGEEARWCPEETARCRLFRWKPGERVSQDDFLATTDGVRRSRIRPDLPKSLTLGDEAEADEWEPAVDDEAEDAASEEMHALPAGGEDDSRS